AAYKFKERIIRILTLTAVISIFLAILLAYGFTAPLANLIDGARFISKGDFNQQIVPVSTDEIGSLTEIFDEMRINLRNTKIDLDYRILQLSTLYEVGKAISSELDFRKLQNMILEIVVKVIKAEKGSLMLLDDSEKTLTIGVAVGLSEEITNNTRLEIGESVAGWVVKNRTPLFVKNAETDPTFLKIKKKYIRTGTLMCVPLSAKDKLLGTLNISRSVPESFSDKDFELFTNLANQAAIAIDNARLYRYAVTDEMTKLYNHRYFQQRLDEELQRADRYENHISLIILDVDHFKSFNDNYGHPEGDRVLKIVARLIEKSVREIDIAARYGGEEFVVICPEKNGEGSLAPAERIRTAIESYDFRVNGERIPLTVSLGVACYPDQARSKTEIIQKADFALYYSKNNGRNRATLYNPIMERRDKHST
ncbi:MAG: diguanylate cyclase, partial [Erysipelotrichia bacterium]|nr:diguanylate cyclase [Erysipelotrichia bacterium]